MFFIIGSPNIFLCALFMIVPFLLLLSLFKFLLTTNITIAIISITSNISIILFSLFFI